MTRYVRYTPTKQDNVVDWPNIREVQFVAEGAREFFVLTHRRGSTHSLSPVDAQTLYWQQVPRAGCSGKPCYFRHQCDTPPDACLTCKIGQNLEGLGLKMRPDPIPPYVEVSPGLRNCCMAGLAIWAVAFLLAWLKTSYETDPPLKTPPAKISYTKSRK